MEVKREVIKENLLGKITRRPPKDEMRTAEEEWTNLGMCQLKLLKKLWRNISKEKGQINTVVECKKS